MPTVPINPEDPPSLPPGQRVSAGPPRVLATMTYDDAKPIVPAAATPARPSAVRSGKASVAVDADGRVVELAVPWQNLLNDEFIVNAPRIPIGGKIVPALGGIPLFAKLGQGGMGAVYYGIHRGLAREVAVKILPFHLTQMKPMLVKRFFREARIAAKISSEHLVRVTDVAQEGSLSYLVMDFVPGKTAAGVVIDALLGGAKGLDESVALDICIAACKGLAAAHAANVVHRDIKPDNVLVPFAKNGKDFDVAAGKLADLGLARIDDAQHSMTNAESCLGTPGYMAPEQIVDSRTGGKPADVFGLGATLYALLCGEAPFTSDTHMQTMWATIEKAHTPVRARSVAVSKPTAEAIDICLSKNPAHRYADGAALLKALQACRRALIDPQSMNYAEVNQPRLDEQKKAAASAASELPELTFKTPPKPPSRAFSPRWLALVSAACVAAGLVYALMAYDYRKPTSRSGDLPNPKALDESLRDSDARWVEEENKRKRENEEYTKKLEALKAAGAAEASKKIQPDQK